MKNLNKYLLTFLFLIPSVALGQTDIQGIIKIVTNIVQSLSGLLAAAALLVFFWGIVKFIASAGSGEEREKAKSIMGWGIIALFVLVSFWGIIRVLTSTFLPGVDLKNPPPTDIFGN